MNGQTDLKQGPVPVSTLGRVDVKTDKKTIDPVDIDVQSPLSSTKGDPNTGNPGFVLENGSPAGWMAPAVKNPDEIVVKPGDYTSALVWDYVSSSGVVKRALKGTKIAHTDLTEHDARIHLSLGYVTQ